MYTTDKNNTKSSLFLALGEKECELGLARSILTDTDVCAVTHAEIGNAEQTMITALSQHSDCCMMVIAAPENGTMLKDALLLSKLAKEHGVLAIVMTPGYKKTPAEYLETESLTMEQLKSCADCILLTPFWCDNVVSGATEREQFYRDVKSFQKYLISVFEGDNFIYLDFDDISSILKDSGLAYFGTANIKGGDTKERKAHMASVEILPRHLLATVKGVIMQIVGSEDMDLEDVEAVANLVHPHTHPDSVLIFGAGFDSELHQELRVGVLVAGIIE